MTMYQKALHSTGKQKQQFVLLFAQDAIQFYTLSVEHPEIFPSDCVSKPNSMTRVRHKLIQDKDQLAELVVHLSSCSIIALDTEFVREKTYLPQLGLIQIADRDDAWIVDPLALDGEAMTPLLEIFINPNILKVVHSAEQDQICLYHGYGIVASPLFDTAIGAALCGFGDQIGLSNLLKKTLNVDLPKSHTRANWLLRPLPKTMMTYALSDVDHLVEAAEVLMLQLDSRERR